MHAPPSAAAGSGSTHACVQGRGKERASEASLPRSACGARPAASRLIRPRAPAVAGRERACTACTRNRSAAAHVQSRAARVCASAARVEPLPIDAASQPRVENAQLRVRPRHPLSSVRRDTNMPAGSEHAGAHSDRKKGTLGRHDDRARSAKLRRAGRWSHEAATSRSHLAFSSHHRASPSRARLSG